MLRNLLMPPLVVFVAMTMGGVLTWFFRRLSKLERQRWGDIENRESLSASMKRVRTRANARHSARTE